MAQYDVYPNLSASAGQGIPFVVVIQSDLLDSLPTRLTIPLATLSYSGKVPCALCPLVTVKAEGGLRVYLDADVFVSPALVRLVVAELLAATAPRYAAFRRTENACGSAPVRQWIRARRPARCVSAAS